MNPVSFVPSRADEGLHEAIPVDPVPAAHEDPVRDPHMGHIRVILPSRYQALGNAQQDVGSPGNRGGQR